MFTGIIEEIGYIESIVHETSSSQLKIRAKKVLGNTILGDSIAVNGVCLTVTELGSDYFIASMVGETKSKISNLTKNPQNYVNLERALTLSKPLGGHIVQGHVDTIGIINDVVKLGNNYEILLSFDGIFGKYAVNKGSISIDGVSLTIADKISESLIKIAVIPHTYENVVLKYRKKGNQVNLEFDILGKYVYNICKNYFGAQDRDDEKILNKLKESGFYE